MFPVLHKGKTAQVENSSGPKAEPCGTPRGAVVYIDIDFFPLEMTRTTSQTPQH